MQHVETLRAVISPTMRMAEADKKPAREELVAGFLPEWARAANKNISGTPFFGGATLNVVDLKFYMVVRWLGTGKVDQFPRRSLPTTRSSRGCTMPCVITPAWCPGYNGNSLQRNMLFERWSPASQRFNSLCASVLRLSLIFAASG